MILDDAQRDALAEAERRARGRSDFWVLSKRNGSWTLSRAMGEGEAHFLIWDLVSRGIPAKLLTAVEDWEDS